MRGFGGSCSNGVGSSGIVRYGAGTSLEHDRRDTEQGEAGWLGNTGEGARQVRREICRCAGDGGGGEGGVVVLGELDEVVEVGGAVVGEVAVGPVGVPGWCCSSGRA